MIDRSGLNLNYSPCKIKCSSSLCLLSVCLSPFIPSFSLPPSTPLSLSALQDVGLILGIGGGRQVFGSTVTRGALNIHTHGPMDVTNRPSVKQKNSESAFVSNSDACVNSDLLSSIGLALGKIGPSENRAWWPLSRLLVLCYGLQKLDMHYVYAADRGKTGQGLEFQI